MKKPKNQSRTPWRMLRLYSIKDYEKFIALCRAEKTSATRELNGFIARTAHNGKLEDATNG